MVAFEQCVRDAVCQSGEVIYKYSIGSQKRQGLGATAIVAILQNDSLVLGQVGDTRGYLFREGEFWGF